MSKFHERAEAQTKQLIGQMLGDELLVQEGKKQQREATEPESTDGGHDQGARPAREQGGPRWRSAREESLTSLLPWRSH